MMRTVSLLLPVLAACTADKSTSDLLMSGTEYKETLILLTGR